MATYILHRLIMGKVEIDICFCFNADISKTKFTEILFGHSTRFIIFFVQIAEFDFLPGRQKG